MEIDIMDIITLDGKTEYTVASKVSYQNNIYYYLINGSNISDIKFCKENKDQKNSLDEITDTNLIKTLFPLFLIEGRKAISLLENKNN